MRRFLKPCIAVTALLATAGVGCGPDLDSVRRLSASALKAEVDARRAVVVDVRGASSYEAGHLAGAVHIPLSAIEARAGELPRDKLIATYCS